jgi:amidase
VKKLYAVPVIIFLFLVNSTGLLGKETSNWSGSWDVQVTFPTGMSAGIMTLEVNGEKITGSSQPLGENKFYPLHIKGDWSVDDATLGLLFRDNKVGKFRLHLKESRFDGNGTLFGMPVDVSASKNSQPQRQPKTHTIYPKSYSTQFTVNTKPILKLIPGDTVRTSTLDNQGRDQSLEWRGMPGNTLTGPFVIEGAMPGDTLIVHLKKITINRDTADMYSGTLNQKSVQGGHDQVAKEGWERRWILDKERQIVRPQKPSSRLSKLELPLKPMIGSIGVAPPLNQSIYAGDLGFHGGNLDYNRIVEGVTVYLPVWRSGAYFYLGDGHARQGEGEISGQGLETSLDVEFEIGLIKGEPFRQIWSEDRDYIMVSGIDNTLDSSFQMATTGMARWLKKNYNLNDSEIATVLSAAIEYDIAEVVDPRPHVVAKVKKNILKMLSGDKLVP